MLKNDQKAEVYILHFNKTYWGKAKHYVGYTTIGTHNRIVKHQNGTGSLLVDYATNKLGIDFVIGRIETFASKQIARWRERKLKSEGHLSRHCSVCQELANAL